MPDQDTLIRRLNAATADQLVDLLASPALEDDTMLRAYLGPECYRRLRSLALRCQMIRREQDQDEYPRENLLIVPGLLGSELTSVDPNGQRECVWLSARSVIGGTLTRLRLAADGLKQEDPSFAIEATGVLKRYYGELMLTLAQHFNVQAFAYDWRKSLATAATELRAYIDNRFYENETLHIVAHAEGGIVARLYQAQNPDQREKRPGRLLLLGTPNYGSISYVQALAGHLAIVWWADLLDTQHGQLDFLSIVRSFPSMYELLPSPTLDEKWTALYEAGTYGQPPEIRQPFLRKAKKLHEALDASVDPAHTVCVVGVNQPTFSRVDVAELIKSMKGAPAKSAANRGPREDETLKIYGLDDGDGRVARTMAELRSAPGEQPVPTFYADVKDGHLLTSPTVLQALRGLLMQPGADPKSLADKLGLHTEWPSPDLEVFTAEPGDEIRKQVQTEWGNIRQTLHASTRQLGSRLTQPDREPVPLDQERGIEDTLVRNLRPVQIIGRTNAPLSPLFPIPKVVFDVKLGDITQLDVLRSADPPVDAIMVGNYLGEAPQGALKALDYAISAALSGKTKPVGQDLILAQLIQRRVIRSESASLFLLPDPRSGTGAPAPTIVIAGQGVPGRFGLPELRLVVRELCWALCRMGKRHLATVLLGLGRNNFDAADVIEMWIRGIKDAVTGMDGKGKSILSVTFVQNSPQKVLEVDAALCQLEEELRKQQRMLIDYTPLTDGELKILEEQVNRAIDSEIVSRKKELGKRLEEARRRREALKKWVEEPLKKDTDASDVPGMTQSGTALTSTEPEGEPIRITVCLEGSIYRFGAITKSAAVPEREIPLDPGLVTQANNELAAASMPEEQIQQGESMARLLLPEDFREHLTGDAPVIMLLDATTARIHWELLRPPTGLERDASDEQPPKPADLDGFLGGGRGLTRQLRTSYAPRPEPLPPPKRLLRILVVADPASDASLPGAQEEGVAVADLFEMYNRLKSIENRTEVVCLIGPADATRTNVLTELMTRSYDVLHFAGHCVYDDTNPVASGWIFSGRGRLTSNEIRRIDRVPSFVFSNACESGVTPDRSGSRSDQLAPAFAEAFFARGVSNFVCTAWPVGDRPARDFALSLYAELLGIAYKGGPRTDPGSYYVKASRPKPMYQAMRNARQAIANSSGDHRTWGAYQHYGNPYFRLFAEVSSEQAVHEERDIHDGR